MSDETFYKIKLDLVQNISSNFIHVMQYDDNGSYIRAEIYKNWQLIPVNEEYTKAEIRMRKPDGKVLQYSTDDDDPVIFIEDDYIKINIVEQMTVVSGSVAASIKLYDLDGHIQTSIFIMMVDFNPIQESEQSEEIKRSLESRIETLETNSIRSDVAQPLTELQKARAKSNIGIMSEFRVVTDDTMATHEPTAFAVPKLTYEQLLDLWNAANNKQDISVEFNIQGVIDAIFKFESIDLKGSSITAQMVFYDRFVNYSTNGSNVVVTYEKIGGTKRYRHTFTCTENSLPSGVKFSIVNEYAWAYMNFSDILWSKGLTKDRASASYPIDLFEAPWVLPFNPSHFYLKRNGNYVDMYWIYYTDGATQTFNMRTLTDADFLSDSVTEL